MSKLITRWKAVPRAKSLVICAIIILVLIYYSSSIFEAQLPAAKQSRPIVHLPTVDLNDGKFHWASVPQKYPVTSLMAVPTPKFNSIPRIQYNFKKETAKDRSVRLERQDAVKGNFTHAWNGYKDHAWLRDEVAPISGQAHDPFGGWAATMVDSLGW
jgi:mannosyl-oligosaccharide alpha-1,2-mannosidase